MGENRGMTTTAETTTDILDVARAQVLERGEALTQAQIVEGTLEEVAHVSRYGVLELSEHQAASSLDWGFLRCA